MDLGFDVVDLGPAHHVAEGEPAPDFTRPLVADGYWEDVALSELTAEGPVVLVFHPMDGDFPATYVWQEIRDREWIEWDASVVGLSISTPYEHAGFLREWRDFDRFRLFSDPGNAVAREYGVAHDLDGMTGVEEPRPAVFAIDGDRRVRYAWVAEQWPDFPPYDRIEAAVGDL